MTKILSFTGHRPDKLFGYNIHDKEYDELRKKIKEKIIEINPDKAISGMALGIDQICAEICIELNIPFIAAVPFTGQERMWPKTSKAAYNELLKKADEIKIVCDGGYSPKKMQIRNEWMVDNSNITLAIWDGTDSGTGNCVKYAKKQNQKLIIIHPKE